MSFFLLVAALSFSHFATTSWMMHHRLGKRQRSRISTTASLPSIRTRKRSTTTGDGVDGSSFVYPGKRSCKKGRVVIRRHLFKNTIILSDRNKDGTMKHGIPFSLSYRVFSCPNSMASTSIPAPVVAIHGGPSLPSDYLEPIVDVLSPNRTIVLYDQLGCGDSDQPTDLDAYSIQEAVDDLEVLLDHLGIQRLHLYGHSFGGILAYEYVRRIAEKEQVGQSDCLSVVLSSASNSVPLVMDEWDRLLALLSENDDVSLRDLSLDERFRTIHQCRTPDVPEPLARAYSKVGLTWLGLEVIKDYVCTPPKPKSRQLPMALILRGEYDFCTEKCVRGWDTFFQHKVHHVLEGCSHFGLLESGTSYGNVLESFFSQHD